MNNKLIFWSMMGLILLTVFLSIFFGNTTGSISSILHVQNVQVGGGDCSADFATGDLYAEPDVYCVTHPTGFSENSAMELSSEQIPVVLSETLIVSTPTAILVENTPISTQIVTPDPGNDPTQIPPPPPTKEKKDKCNKGSGNGSEGCDPGNNPDNGNDDESPGNDEKKDKNKK